MNRASPGFLLILFFAILAGLAGVYAWKKSAVRPVAVQPTPAAPKPQVFIVASIDLPSGRVVHDSDFMSVTIPPSKLKERVKSWPALLLSDGRQIVNRRIKNPVKQGEPFAPETFYAEGIEPDITDKLSPGMRAFSIMVPAEGIPSKATPGAIVDVLFRTKADENFDLPEISRTLMEGVQLLAIGNNATFGSMGLAKGETQDRTMTLAVTPEQVLVLKTTEGHGEFSIALRRTEDGFHGMNEELKLTDLFDIPVPEPEPKPFVAEVFRRGQRQTLTFAPSGNLISQNTPKVKPKKGKKYRPPYDGNTNDDGPSNDSDVKPVEPPDMDALQQPVPAKPIPNSQRQSSFSRVSMLESGH